MNILNMLFTGLFTVEMILKLIAFKPKVGPGNRLRPAGTRGMEERRVGAPGEGQKWSVKDHVFSDDKYATSYICPDWAVAGTYRKHIPPKLSCSFQGRQTTVLLFPFPTLSLPHPST